MPPTLIDLEPTDQAALDDLLACGHYRNESEAIGHALRLAQQQAHLQWERAEVQRGWDALDAGDYVEISNDEELSAFMAGCSARASARVAARRAGQAVAS